MSLIHDVKPSHSVDSRSCCVGNMLEAKKGMHFIKVGEILEVICDCQDDDIQHYLPLWVKKMGHELVKIEDCGRIYKIWIRKLF